MWSLTLCHLPAPRRRGVARVPRSPLALEALQLQQQVVASRLMLTLMLMSPPSLRASTWSCCLLMVMPASGAASGVRRAVEAAAGAPLRTCGGSAGAMCPRRAPAVCTRCAPAHGGCVAALWISTVAAAPAQLPSPTKARYGQGLWPISTCM